MVWFDLLLCCARSLESTSVKTMQLVANMTEKAHITIPDLPSVPKTHDDLFLRCKCLTAMTLSKATKYRVCCCVCVCSQSGQPLHRRA